jgi:penicillin amidase
MTPRRRRVLRWSVVVLLALAGVGLYSALHVLRGPGLPEGDRVVRGPGATVEILWDSLGVPHIWAESVSDAYFGQGYVHATQRLWQMELFRRVAEGRLSELFGEATVETDRFLRRLNLARAAQGSLRILSPEFVSEAEAYAAGVNSALAEWEGALPPEFLLLGAEPEPWSPVLVASLEKIMAWDLSEYQAAMGLANARAEVGDSAVRELLPSHPDWGVTILGGWPEEASSADAVSTPSLPPAGPSGSAPVPLLSARTAQFLEIGSISVASNSWVIGGERTRSGKPLLANDMHLALDAPNIWFLVGLHAPGLDVVGMSLPGAPGVVAGHSAAVAWGFTNASLDDSDLFVERVDPSDPSRYLTPGGSEPFEVREERIRVRGGEEVTDTVRSTRHGPVLTELEGGTEVLAFQWVGFEPSRTLQAVGAMNRARSADEFLNALADLRNPHQNVVYADTAGSWGYWMAGSIPLRRSGRPATLPVPGWTGEFDWVGRVPFAEHPHAISPARGYVATANNAQGRDSVSLLVNDGGWARPYRAGRISALIEETDLHDVGTATDMQKDVVSLFALRYRDRAVAAFRAAGLQGEGDRLAAWDGAGRIPSREAALFHTWVRSLREILRRDFHDGDAGYFPMYMVERALDGAGSSPDSAQIRAAREAATSVDDRAWGDLHTLALGHPLGGLPLLGGLAGFGRDGIAREGSPHSVNVSSFGGRRPPFRSTHGPSQRHVVDLADVDGSGGFILPGGQSGYPRGAHSFDQLGRWLQGELWLLPLARERVEARTVARLRLIPE